MSVVDRGWGRVMLVDGSAVAKLVEEEDGTKGFLDIELESDSSQY